MKRKIVTCLLVLVTIICCAMGLSACSNDNSTETFCGTWKTEKLILDSGTQKVEFETNFVLTANEDGTIYASKQQDVYSSKEGSGTWREVDGRYEISITFDDHSTMNLSAKIEKKKLIAQDTVVTPYNYIMVKTAQ